jgi:hypothetical protein
MRHFSVLLSAQSASNLNKKPPPRSCSSQFPRSPTRRKPVRAVVAEEAVASVGTWESALGASLAAVGVWVLSAVLSAARVSAVAELDRSEPAISPGGPLRRHGQASQRRASLPIALQAHA